MKRTITIVIVVLLAIGLGYWLFKISPQQDTSAGEYNSAIKTDNVKPLSEFPKFDPAMDRFMGNKEAKNVFVEYADFQCPACASFSPILKDVSAQFENTVFVYRYFPLVQIHGNAVVSALAAEAAGAQGKYWEMHDKLFEKQSDWEGVADPLNLFAQYAQEAGVANIDQFRSDITSKKYLEVIQKHNNQALGLNLRGTPTMFFNGHEIQPSDLANMKKQAEQWMVK